MTTIEDRIKLLIKSEKNALASDDPKGNCAAHHRGAINAYYMVLYIMQEGGAKNAVSDKGKGKSK
jgi:hypothetical protein